MKMIPEEEPNIKEMSKEEIEMKLDKIDELEAKIIRIDGALIQLSKRITKLQDQKEDRKCSQQ